VIRQPKVRGTARRTLIATHEWAGSFGPSLLREPHGIIVARKKLFRPSIAPVGHLHRKGFAAVGVLNPAHAGALHLTMLPGKVVDLFKLRGPSVRRRLDFIGRLVASRRSFWRSALWLALRIRWGAGPGVGGGAGLRIVREGFRLRCCRWRYRIHGLRVTGGLCYRWFARWCRAFWLRFGWSWRGSWLYGPRRSGWGRRFGRSWCGSGFSRLGDAAFCALGEGAPGIRHSFASFLETS